MIYNSPRDDMAPLVPEAATSILDVGCSTGNFGELLRTQRDAVLWGIDPTPPPMNRPSPYDRRITGRFPEDLPATEPFDCIVFNDVLEHMIDPWTVLAATRSFLSPDGIVVASIPNIRHLSVLAPLLVAGRWNYVDWGVLDRTHLRFFTRKSMIDLFEGAGYQVEHIEPHWISGERFAWRRLLGGRFDELAAHQYAVVARPAAPSRSRER